jgi:hypothetical protein
VDVETTGQYVDGPTANRVVAVGVAWAACTGREPVALHTVRRRRWSLALDAHDTRWEARCLREFWCKQPLAADALLRDTSDRAPRVSETEFAREFVALLHVLHQEHAHLTVLADAPAFDLGWVNSLLCRAGFPTVSLATGSWIPVVDTDSYVRGAADAKPSCLGCLADINDGLVAHLPEDDAALALLTYAAVRADIAGHRVVDVVGGDNDSDATDVYVSD